MTPRQIAQQRRSEAARRRLSAKRQREDYCGHESPIDPTIGIPETKEEGAARFDPHGLLTRAGLS